MSYNYLMFQDKQGDISEDDTVRFKSYLMSLGIDDPVTRDTFRSDSDYYMGLAQQISDMMVAVLLVRSLCTLSVAIYENTIISILPPLKVV